VIGENGDYRVSRGSLSHRFKHLKDVAENLRALIVSLDFVEDPVLFVVFHEGREGVIKDLEPLPLQCHKAAYNS